MNDAVIGCLVALLAFACSNGAKAADSLPSPPPSTIPVPVQLPPQNSIFVFGGVLSTANMYSTATFNLTKSAEKGQHYDNSIVGVAYNRNIVGIGFGFHLGIEVGIADRFGHYRVCCDIVTKSDSLVQSGELWGGVQIRSDGIVLFDQLRISGAFTFGPSVATSSIGRERNREIDNPGSARLLYYLGPELNFSTPSLPNFEFVIKLHHRSGGKAVPFLSTLGNMGEGYNVHVVGVRYLF